MTKKSMPAEDHFLQAADMLSVLGHDGRLKLLWLLDQHGSLSVSDLVDMLNLTQSNVSHQLRILRDARLVRAERSGQRMIYHLADDHVMHMMRDALVHVAEETH